MDSREFRVPGTRTISPYHRHAGGSRTKIAGAQVAPKWHSADSSSRIRPAPPDARYLSKTSPYAFLRVPRSPKPPKRPAAPQLVPRRVRRLVREAFAPVPSALAADPSPARAASSPPRPSSRSPRDAPSPFDAHAACGPPRAATGDGSSSLSIPHASRPERETRPPRTRRRRAGAADRARRRRRTTSRPSFPHLSRDARANRPVVDTNTNRRVSIRILIATTTLRRTRRRAPSPSRPASRRRSFATISYRRFVRDVRLCPRRSRRRFFELRLARRALRRLLAPSSRSRARSRASPRVDASRSSSAPSPVSRASPRGLRPADRPARAARRWRDTPPSGLSGRWTSARRHSRAMVCAPSVRAGRSRGERRGPSGRGGRSDGAEGGVRDGAGDVAGGDGADLEVALAASKRGGLLRSEFVSTGADATHQLGEHRGRVRPRVGRAEPVPEDAAGGERAGASGGRGGRRRGSVAEVAPGEPGADAHRSRTRRAMCRTRAEKRVDVGARRRRQTGMRTFEPARLHESIGASHLNMEYDEIT